MHLGGTFDVIRRAAFPGGAPAWRAIPPVWRMLRAATVLDIVNSSMSFPKQRAARLARAARFLQLPAKFQAAFWFTLRSAMSLSFWSVAFSSSRFCCRTAAQSSRPSFFAHAISVP